MSEASEIDLREQIVRIDRMIEESRKFSEETRKFTSEQRKLLSEAAKLDRDRSLAPWVTIAAVVGGTLGLATFILRLAGH